MATTLENYPLIYPISFDPSPRFASPKTMDFVGDDVDGLGCPPSSKGRVSSDQGFLVICYEKRG